MADNRTHFVVGSGQFINNETPFLTWLNFDVLTHLQDVGATEILPINQANQAGIMLDFGYKLETSVNARVTSFQISLVANNAITGERWEFDRVNVGLQPNLIQNNGVQIVDSQSSRNYKINSASPFNLVTLESTALVGTEQFYEGVVAQKITWQDYIANNNVAALFFNNAFPNNNRNQKSSNYSNENDFTIHLLATAVVEGNDSVVGQSTQTIERLSSPINVYDYFESDDGVVTTGDIQVFDETETINLGDDFVLGQTVLFRTEWSGPNPLDIANLGYVLHSLEPKEANSNLQIEESSTFRGITEGGALSQVIAVQEGANIVSRCFIDTSIINLQDYTFSAYLETPGLPTSVGYVLIDFKSGNGRNVVFTARVDIFAGGKAFSSVNNEVTTADLLFRIGDTTAALNDANNAGWAAFTPINWAAFNAAAIPAGAKVRCEYTGSSTVVDLPCRIKCGVDEAPTATVTNTIFTNSKIAASDVLLATETEMTVNVVTTQFGTTKFYANRTDLEIANSENLTDFVSGIAAASPLDLNKTGHIYTDRTTINGIGQLSIQTTSTDATLGNIIGIASPLQNIYYPASSNGLNLPALRYDGINDVVTAAVTALNWNTIADGSYVYIRACVNNKGGSSRLIAAPPATPNIQVTPAGIITFQNGTVNISPPKFNYLDGEVIFTNIILRKKGNSGTAAQLVYLDDCFTVINSRHSTYQVNVNGTATPTPTPTLLLGTNLVTGGLQQNAVYKLGFSILLAPPTLEECYRFCRGEAVPNMQYEWNFTALAGTQLTAIGTIAHPNADVLGGAGVGSLFN